MKRIALIGACGKNWCDQKRMAFIATITPPGYEVVPLNPEYGTHCVEVRLDEAYNSPHILKQVIRAANEKFDAMVIDCAGDPALDAAREITTVPVVGVRRANLHLALTLGTKFAIVTIGGPATERWIESGVRAEGLEPFCAKVIALKMGVLDIAKGPAYTQSEVLEACKRAIALGADVVSLGCTGFSAEIDVQAIRAELGIPILDPLTTGIRTAALLVDSELSHSKVAYPMPTRKPMTEDPALAGVFDQVIKA